MPLRRSTRKEYNQTRAALAHLSPEEVFLTLIRMSSGPTKTLIIREAHCKEMAMVEEAQVDKERVVEVEHLEIERHPLNRSSLASRVVTIIDS